MSDDRYSDIPDDEPLDDAAIFRDMEGPARDAYIDRVLGQYGALDYEGIRLDLSDVDADKLRGVRFDSFEDVLLYLVDGGILDLFNIVFIPDEDLFGIEEDYPSASAN